MHNGGESVIMNTDNYGQQGDINVRMVNLVSWKGDKGSGEIFPHNYKLNQVFYNKIKTVLISIIYWTVFFKKYSMATRICRKSTISLTKNIKKKLHFRLSYKKSQKKKKKQFSWEILKKYSVRRFRKYTFREIIIF